jgi:DeoR/GlpR family transcriptional regulator of sugar metabolism
MVPDIPPRRHETVNQEENAYIAKFVAAQVKDGETLMLDASAVSLYAARLLKQRVDLTIITNSVEILMTFAFIKRVSVISTGGHLRKNDYALCGTGAEQVIKGFHVDKAIISCSAIHRDHGLTEASEQEAHIKRLMADSAKHVIAAAAANKFDNVSLVHFLDVSRIHTLITNEPPGPHWRDYLKQNNIELIV